MSVVYKNESPLKTNYQLEITNNNNKSKQKKTQLECKGKKKHIRKENNTTME